MHHVPSPGRRDREGDVKTHVTLPPAPPGYTPEEWAALPWGVHLAYESKEPRELAAVAEYAAALLASMRARTTPPPPFDYSFKNLHREPEHVRITSDGDGSVRRCVCGICMVYANLPGTVEEHEASEPHRAMMVERGLWTVEEHPPILNEAFSGASATPATPATAMVVEAREGSPAELPPDPLSLPPLRVYTDGSGTIATRVCGAGVVVMEGDVIVAEITRHLGLGTNNRAEVSGVGTALRMLGDSPWRGRRLVVCSDSEYTIHALSKAEDPHPQQPNARLIEVVRRMLPGSDRCAFEHVKGHSGVVGNERADTLAGWGRTLYLETPEASAETAATGAIVMDLGTEVVAEVSRHGGVKPLAELASARLAVRMLDAPHWRKRPVVLRTDSEHAIETLRAKRDPDSKFLEALARFHLRGRLERLPPEE